MRILFYIAFLVGFFVLLCLCLSYVIHRKDKDRYGKIIDNLNLYKIRGIVLTKEELPLINLSYGDIYKVVQPKVTYWVWCGPDGWKQID